MDCGLHGGDLAAEVLDGGVVYSRVSWPDVAVKGRGKAPAA